LAGDLILAAKSHQAALIALLNEHVSLYGTRVKIFSRDGDDFPGGHAYNMRKSFMKDLIAGVHQPYVFHMSWTVNKDNKMKYFQQLGEWFFDDTCIQKTANDMDVKACCLTEPLLTCYYRDKPSLHPCKDSPAIDKGAQSFW
jgi:hypothetical protein